MQIVSLNIGRPQVLVRHGRQYSSAINRKPADGPIELTVEGLAGDRVSDDRVHGGPDKALCCYPIEHYEPAAAWLNDGGRLDAAQDSPPAELPVPSFGENLTTRGLLEAEVCIGDTFRVGSAVVQVSQPRQPCGKLALKHSAPQMPAWIVQTGFTGFYFRVLQAGRICAGDPLGLTERPCLDFTITGMIRHRFAESPDHAWLERAIALPQLSTAFRAQLQARLTPG
jgi:MOSC domain-containing protein YiiM